jgi:hypothetical protein
VRFRPTQNTPLTHLLKLETFSFIFDSSRTEPTVSSPSPRSFQPTPQADLHSRSFSVAPRVGRGPELADTAASCRWARVPHGEGQAGGSPEARGGGFFARKHEGVARTTVAGRGSCPRRRRFSSCSTACPSLPLAATTASTYERL